LVFKGIIYKTIVKICKCDLNVWKMYEDIYIYIYIYIQRKLKM